MSSSFERTRGPPFPRHGRSFGSFSGAQGDGDGDGRKLLSLSEILNSPGSESLKLWDLFQDTLRHLEMSDRVQGGAGASGAGGDPLAAVSHVGSGITIEDFKPFLSHVGQELGTFATLLPPQARVTQGHDGVHRGLAASPLASGFGAAASSAISPVRRLRGNATSPSPGAGPSSGSSSSSAFPFVSVRSQVGMGTGAVSPLPPNRRAPPGGRGERTVGSASFHTLPVRQPSGSDLGPSPSARGHSDASHTFKVVPQTYFREDFEISKHSIFKQPLKAAVVQQEKLTADLDLIEVALFEQIRDRFQPLMAAVGDLEQKQKDVKESLEAASKLREELRVWTEVKVTRRLRLAALARRRERIATLCRLAQSLHTVRQLRPTLQLLVSSQDFPTALQLLSSSSTVLSQQLKGVKLAASFERQIEEVVENLDQMLETDFVLKTRPVLNTEGSPVRPPLEAPPTSPVSGWEWGWAAASVVLENDEVRCPCWCSTRVSDLSLDSRLPRFCEAPACLSVCATGNPRTSGTVALDCEKLQRLLLGLRGRRLVQQSLLASRDVILRQTRKALRNVAARRCLMLRGQQRRQKTRGLGGSPRRSGTGTETSADPTDVGGASEQGGAAGGDADGEGDGEGEAEGDEGEGGGEKLTAVNVGSEVLRLPTDAFLSLWASLLGYTLSVARRYEGLAGCVVSSLCQAAAENIRASVVASAEGRGAKVQGPPPHQEILGVCMAGVDMFRSADLILNHLLSRCVGVLTGRQPSLGTAPSSSSSDGLEEEGPRGSGEEEFEGSGQQERARKEFSQIFSMTEVALDGARAILEKTRCSVLVAAETLLNSRPDLWEGEAKTLETGESGPKDAGTNSVGGPGTPGSLAGFPSPSRTLGGESPGSSGRSAAAVAAAGSSGVGRDPFGDAKRRAREALYAGLGTDGGPGGGAKGSTAAGGTLRVHLYDTAKNLLEEFHQSRVASLSLLLSEERWERVEIPSGFSGVLAPLVSPPSTSSSSKPAAAGAGVAGHSAGVSGREGEGDGKASKSFREFRSWISSLPSSSSCPSASSASPHIGQSAEGEEEPPSSSSSSAASAAETSSASRAEVSFIAEGPGKQIGICLVPGVGEGPDGPFDRGNGGEGGPSVIDPGDGGGTGGGKGAVFLPVSAALALIQTAREYWDFAGLFPCVVGETLQRLLHLFKLFNKLTLQLVLGGGAVAQRDRDREGGAGTQGRLKRITAQNLAVCSQSLGLLASLLPKLHPAFSVPLRAERRRLRIVEERLGSIRAHVTAVARGGSAGSLGRKVEGQGSEETGGDLLAGFSAELGGVALEFEEHRSKVLQKLADLLVERWEFHSNKWLIVHPHLLPSTLSDGEVVQVRVAVVGGERHSGALENGGTSHEAETESHVELPPPHSFVTAFAKDASAMHKVLSKNLPAPQLRGVFMRAFHEMSQRLESAFASERERLESLRGGNQTSSACAETGDREREREVTERERVDRSASVPVAESGGPLLSPSAKTTSTHVSASAAAGGGGGARHVRPVSPAVSASASQPAPSPSPPPSPAAVHPSGGVPPPSVSSEKMMEGSTADANEKERESAPETSGDEKRRDEEKKEKEEKEKGGGGRFRMNFADYKFPQLAWRREKDKGEKEQQADPVAASGPRRSLPGGEDPEGAAEKEGEGQPRLRLKSLDTGRYAADVAHLYLSLSQTLLSQSRGSGTLLRTPLENFISDILATFVGEAAAIAAASSSFTDVDERADGEEGGAFPMGRELREEILRAALTAAQAEQQQHEGVEAEGAVLSEQRGEGVSSVYMPGEIGGAESLLSPPCYKVVKAVTLVVPFACR
uniref:Vacuolar protein sorting-associated protein 54 n=1 Tax=Chromera velia CCMP2878 TaxID=1169474 RepID=A0A0G4G923_9ALVE|eukprot:Cvel_602.t1-p1 / transcript=Cvel_602.t1 / gene=Cvel_602 / organism=Chromera_velia_CCMP2878 / gene_product=hypothetical protein / transcript_product=hypothetical protein / location=Cvel_scaffold18:169185-180031(+) / protein_length=1819 / sequence_SO=supercontig / SO=protein_coding / is_pseudo=false